MSLFIIQSFSNSSVPSDNQRIPRWAACSTHSTLWVATQWAEHWAQAAWPPAYRRAPTQTTWRESHTQRWPSIRHHLVQYWSKMTFTFLASIQRPPWSFPIRGQWAAPYTTSDRCQSRQSTERPRRITACRTADRVRRHPTNWPLTSSNISVPAQTQTPSHSNRISESKKVKC